MKGKFYLYVVVIFFFNAIYAQHFNPPVPLNSTGYSGTGANIDVVYHRCDWTIDPRTGKNVAGTVTTYFKTAQANVSAISFDLNKASFNNGSLVVTYHGIACTKSFPASGAVNILNITLPSAIAATNTLDSIVITYAGTPPSVSGAAQGYQASGTTGNGGTRYVTSLSESFEDRDWWPCKADMQDKIDSMDIIVNVPWATATSDTFWVATNGVLLDSTITGSNRKFTFKTRYPIASYLVCISVGKFTRYHRTVNVNGTNTPVVYYLLRNTSNQSTKVATMDQINPVLVAFSNKFGDYPFKLEKHGFYDGLLGAGGMEHQTFSAIATSSFNIKTLTHELMHQWFGDNVTFATWNDLWLAEGFARYSEALAPELVSGLGYTAYSERNSIKNAALGLSAQSAWIPNSSMSSSNLIWNSNYGSTVYERGAMIVSMLRAMSGDTKFFQACTNYQTSLKGKAATADSLKNYFNAVLGIDISEFFNDYAGGSGSGTTAVGGIGNPINVVNWNTPVAKKLVLQMGTQTKTGGSNVSYFNGPVVVHATNAASGWTKDTTIVLFDWGGGTISYAGNGISVPNSGFLSYDLSFTPTNLFYDDSARTMTTGSTNKLSTLAASILNFTARKIITGNETSLSIFTTEPITKVEIQKSANGSDFVTAGQMDLFNTNNQVADYRFNDPVPFSPETFYRAKVYYSSGEHFTNIAKVQSLPGKGLIVTPNPAAGNVKIMFNNAGSEEAVIKITNADGKLVFEAKTKKDFIDYNVSSLLSGIYLVSIVQNGTLSETNRLIVQH
jgi:hypothetical protein